VVFKVYDDEDNTDEETSDDDEDLADEVLSKVYEDSIVKSLANDLQVWPWHTTDWGLYKSFLTREYGSLLDEDSFTKVNSSVTFDNAKHAEISKVRLADMGTLRSGSMTRQWHIQFRYNSRMIATEEGGKFFLMSGGRQELEVEVFRKDKSVGTASIKELADQYDHGDIRTRKIHCPIGRGKLSAVLKVDDTSIYLDSELVSSLLSDTIREIACRALSPMFPKLQNLETSGRIDTQITRYVQLKIKQEGSMAEHEVRVTFRGMHITLVKNHAICPVKDLTGDVLKIEVMRNAENSSGKLKLSADSDSKENTETVLFSKTYRPSEISLREGETVAFEDLGWTLSLRLCRDDKTRAFDATPIQIALFCVELSKMSGEQRMAWRGGLVYKLSDLYHLYKVSSPDGEQWDLSTAEALIAANTEYDFNNAFLSEALQKLDHNVAKLFERKQCFRGIKKYMVKVALALSNLTDATNKENVIQIHHMIKNISLFGNSCNVQQWFKDKLKRCHNAKAKHYFQSQDVNDQKRHANEYALPTLQCIEKEFPGPGELELHWRNSLADSILYRALPKLERFLTQNNIESCADGKMTFNLYMLFKQIVQHQRGYNSRFYNLFEPCHDLWVETIYKTADKQVKSVIKLGQETGDDTLVHDGLNNPEWILTAKDVGGIFKTCEITWKQMDWPDHKKNVMFGLKLTRKLSEVFNLYVHSFHDIIMSDDKFAKHELAIVLNILSQSSYHFDSLFETLSESIGEFMKSGIQQGDDASAYKVESISRDIHDCKKKAFECADSMVKSFCQEQERELDSIRCIYNEDNDKECVLGHVYALLEFFKQHLEMSTDALTEKYKLLIAQYLFESVEARFVNDYKSKVASSDEMHDCLRAAEELVKFEEFIGIEQGDKFKAFREAVTTAHILSE
jgi:hypothetical protein